MFGTAGLPHILMRFFTVKDSIQARKSVVYATGFIGYFYILTFIIGFGAIILVGSNSAYLNPEGGLIGNNNMAAIHLAHAVGGDVLLGFISAVAFATILAVVSGLTLAGDQPYHMISMQMLLILQTKMKKNYLFQTCNDFLGYFSNFLGIIFEKQNIAFMVGLAFAIAASTNFPIIFLSMFWRNLTTRSFLEG